MKYSQLSRFIFLGLLCIGNGLFAQNNLLGYWNFNDANNLHLDASTNALHINAGPASLRSSPDGMVGRCLVTGDTIPSFQPGVTPTQIFAPGRAEYPSPDDVTLQFAFRTNELSDVGVLVGWSNRLTFALDNGRIRVYFKLQGQPEFQQIINLTGTNRQDPKYYYDGEWHHIALSYSTKNRRLRIYVDGVCPGGDFERVLPFGNPIELGGKIWFGRTISPPNTIFEGFLDEVAIWNEELSPELIYQNYLDLVNGQAYSATTNLTAQDIPSPGPVRGAIDPGEFAPGYPFVQDSTIHLLRSYPGARYPRRHRMPRIDPYVRDYGDLAGPIGTGGNNWRAATQLQRELAGNFHHKLLLGKNYYAYRPVEYNPGKELYEFIQLANSPVGGMDTIPRLVMTNWLTARPQILGRGYVPNSSWIRFGGHPNGHYVTNRAGNPVGNPPRINPALDPLHLDSVGYDGLAAFSAIDTILTHLNRKVIESLSENGEIASINFNTVQAEMCADPVIYSHALRTHPANPPASTARCAQVDWGAYISDNKVRISHRYRDSLVNLLAQRNQQAGDPLGVDFSWYNNAGKPDAFADFSYGRTLHSSRDGRLRSAPYYYPQAPDRWWAGVGITPGFRQYAPGRDIENALGANQSNPFISPGFVDGLGYKAKDRNMIRPGQWLGITKHLAVMGADTYTLFMENAQRFDYQPGQWRIWKMAIPAYAQAIISRVDSFMYEGHELPGDQNYLSIVGSNDGSVYSFHTGNPQDYVTIRKMDASEVYLIAGSAQRSSNFAGNSLLEKEIGVQIGTDSLFFEVRRQGSVYYFDKRQPSNPIFFQLDKWHEWKEPGNWCPDFSFEAEVWDSVTGPVQLHTEFPGTGYDFTEFTGYAASNGGAVSLQYRFQVRRPDQDSLYLWIRARRNASATPASIEALVPGVGAYTLPVVTSTTWDWYGLDVNSAPVLFTPGQGDQLLLLSLLGTGLEVDRILLNREAALPGNILAAFTAQPQCAGLPTTFQNQSQTGTGCTEIHWDFGDGLISSEFEPEHTYQYPDTYQVVLTLTEPNTETVSRDTQVVIIPGFYVEAGRDTFVCRNSLLQLNGQATGCARWLPDPALTNPLNPQTTVRPTENQYFILMAEDPVSGCSARDSVFVSVVYPNLQPIRPQSACVNDIITIEATGAYSYIWPDSNDMVSVNGNTVEYASSTAGVFTFSVIGEDICGCSQDTSTFTVTVYDTSALNITILDTLPVCEGDSIRIQARGGWSYSWSDGQNNTSLSHTNGSDITVGPVVPSNFPDSANYDFEVYVTAQTGCGGTAPTSITDTIIIPTLNAPRPGGIRDVYTYTNESNGICRALISGLPTNEQNHVTYHWSVPAGTLSDTAVRNPFVTVPWPSQVNYVHTYTATGCTLSGSVQVIPDGALQDTFYVCAGEWVNFELVGVDNGVRWFPGDLVEDSLGFQTRGQFFADTMLTVLSYNDDFCATLDSVHIFVRDPVRIVTPDTAICAQTAPQLNVLATGVDFYNWQPGAAFSDSTIANPVVTLGQDSLYHVMACDSFGCVTRDTVTLRWIQPPGISTPDTTICPGDTITLTAASGQSWNWPQSGQNTQSITVSPSVDTLYNLVYTDSICGNGQDSVLVSISTPQFITRGDTQICRLDSVALTTSGGVAFTWTPVTSLSGLPSGNPVAGPDTTTLYQVVILDSAGCTWEDSVLITVPGTRPGIAQNDTTLCLGDSIVLNATGGTTWDWLQNSQTTQTIVEYPTVTTRYDLQWTDSVCGNGLDTVLVTVNQPVLNTILVPTQNQTICAGDSLELQTSGGVAFQWSPAGMVTNTTSATTYAIGPQQGWYYANITDTNGCNVVDSVFLTYQTPIGLLTSDTLLCQGDSITLVAETGPPGTAYHWSPAGDFASASPTAVAQNTLLSSRSTETFVLNTTTNTGCSFFDTVAVSVDTMCCYIAGAGYAFRQDTLPAPAGISGQVISIRDTLWIDGIVTLSNSTLEMQPYAVIWVLPGASLTIDNSTVRAGCGVMWDGIYTEGITANVVISNSTVQDALNGVVSLQGGGFRLSGNTFRNNYLGMKVMPYAGTHTGEVVGTRFTGRAVQMLPPKAGELPEAGIWVNRVGRITLGVANPATHNVFDSIGVGIISEVSNVTVQGATFRKLLLKPNRKTEPGYNGYGSGIYAYGLPGIPAQTTLPRLTVGITAGDSCDFHDCVYGIRARDNIALEAKSNFFETADIAAIRADFCMADSILIRENRFENNLWGVFGMLNTGSRVEITKNELVNSSSYPGIGFELGDINLFGMPVANGGGYYVAENVISITGTGITANAVGPLLIERNNITIQGHDPTYTWNAGISIHGSDSAKIRDNALVNNGALTDSIDGIRLNLSSRVIVSCNDISRFPVGLHSYGSCDLSRIFYNDFYDGHWGVLLDANGNVGQQGAAGNPSLNTWSGWTCGVNNRYMVVTRNTNPLTDWYTRNTPQNNPAHPVNPGCSNAQGSGSPLSFQSTSGRVASNCFQQGPRGNGNGGRNNPNLTVGINTPNSGSTLREIANGSRVYLQYDSASRYMEEQMALALFEANPSLCLGDTLLAGCHFNFKNSHRGRIYEGLKNAMTQNPVNASVANNIVPGFSLEQNHQDALGIYLNLLNVGDSLSSGDSTLLFAIGQMCPLAEGRGVYLARTLRKSLDPLAAFPEACGSPAKAINGKTVEPGPEKVPFVVAPNPATHQVTISWQSNGIVTVFDGKGKLLATWSHVPGSRNLNLASWDSGIYFIRYVSDSGQSGTQKIIKQ